MSAARTLLSIWLVPAEPARSLLEQRIDELARRYDAPRFLPHITLFAGTTTGVEWRDRLARAAHGIPACSVQVIGVGHSDQLFKTAFLQIATSATLSALQRRVAAALGAADGYLFEPHLSLVYKTLSEATRADLAREIDAPATFVCDALSVVLPSDIGWPDVAGWQVRHTEPLAPPGS
jgi:putative hydrolase of the HAD superfamily